MKRKLSFIYIKILEIFVNICCVFIINKKRRNFFRKDKKINSAKAEIKVTTDEEVKKICKFIQKF